MTPPDGATPEARPNAFAHRPFRLFWTARLCATLGLQMQVVAVGWHLYALTGSALALGLVGLAQFAPNAPLLLVSGTVADRFDRRAILRLCFLVEAAGMLALALLALSGDAREWPVYAVVAALGAAHAFVMPAAASLVPNLVPARDFPNAVALNSSVFQGASIAGPALGGLLYALGPAAVFGLCGALLLAAAALVAMVRVAPRTVERRAATLSELVAGIAFVRSKPAVLGAISLDMMAVLLGGATALLPIVAAEVLLAGPLMLGLLRSAPAVGALAVGLWLARNPIRRGAGRAMFAAVAAFGAATIAFGLSTEIWVSLLALTALGAADMVSVVIRQTLVQLATPDAMRGRVAAVNALFIGTSNQLGEFESGVTAALWGAVPAIVVGGLGTLAVAAAWMWMFPSLRRIDRLEAEELA
jgi:MFS family permease